MNYTRAQLEAMSDLPGSKPDMKLKVSTEDTKVWLARKTSPMAGVRYEVVVETLQGAAWRVSKRYPA